MKKRSGFTLAEVLITLGIIGVVAAMTIPTLIQNTNSVRFATQFKKSISTLSQAALMSQAQYDIDYAGTSVASDQAGVTAENTTATGCAAQTVASGNYTICGILNNTLAGQTYQGAYSEVKGADNTALYSSSVTMKTTSIPMTNMYVYALSDGSFVGFDKTAKKCSLGAGNVLDNTMLTSGALKDCLGFIDVNGAKPPNTEVTCSDGTAALTPNTPCALAATGSTVGDIYPIVFHDGVVEPATNASKSTLARGK